MKLDIFIDFRKYYFLLLCYKLKLLLYRGEISEFNFIVVLWEEKWELLLKEEFILIE